MVRIEDILERVTSYNPSANLDIIKQAYIFSAKVHKGQTRISGEPYLAHPLAVAKILTDLKMDVNAVATGLLHDTVEDTFTTIDEIRELFGEEIANLVDALTKLSHIAQWKKEDVEAENFRKMLLAMAKDIRVVLIKLADRLHNMRTLSPLPREKQKKIAQETLDIYAPLANRLGIGWIKTELEDLSFKYLEPERYRKLKELIIREEKEKERYISVVTQMLSEKLKEHKIEGEISGRLKHLYSIYRKMEEQGVDFENIYDILAFRVIVNSVRDCYSVLGIVHSLWKPLPWRFKDYIALPKQNMYQSLHTTVVGPEGKRMEIQIRTKEMHRIAEYGIAAHWKYKEGKPHTADKHELSFAWIRRILEWQKDLKDSFEFLETLKVDLFPEEIFVFTPKGDIKVFPAGATPVDFAYGIHTDVGHRCAGARVNGKMVPLKYRLQNGDVVEIITSPHHKPSKDWLKFVVTSRAKTRIRRWIKTEEREKSLALGREICEKELKKHNLEFSELVKSGELEKVARLMGFNSIETLLVNIGYGKIPVGQVVNKLLPEGRLSIRKRLPSFKKVFQRLKGKTTKEGIKIRGMEDILVKFAGCCNPLPGEPIMGLITTGQGITIHHKSCQNIIDVDPERRVEAEWDRDAVVSRPVKIEVISLDEKGLLADMTNIIKNADANITGANIRTTTDRLAICTFEIEVHSVKHLNFIMKELESVKKIKKVTRLKDGGRLKTDEADSHKSRSRTLWTIFTGRKGV